MQVSDNIRVEASTIGEYILYDIMKTSNDDTDDVIPEILHETENQYVERRKAEINSEKNIIMSFLNKLLNYKTKERNIDELLRNEYKKQLEEKRNGKKKTKVKFFFTVDNSASMEYLTSRLTNTIISGLVDIKELNTSQYEIEPATLICFSSNAKVLSENIRSSSDLEKIKFPSQGQTNITGAVYTTLKSIQDYNFRERQQDPDVDVINIFIFLSDGQHNVGEKLGEINHLKKSIDHLNLGVVIVGIYKSDNSLGMKIKEIGNYELPHLDNIYYVNSSDMKTVLSEMVNGIKNTFETSLSLDISLVNSKFIENLTEIKTSLKESLSFIVKKTSSDQQKVLINGLEYNPVVVPLTYEKLESAFEYHTSKLSRKRLVQGLRSIESNINELNEILDLFDSLKNEISDNVTNDDIGRIRMTPQQKVTLLRKFKNQESKTLELRNQLRNLRANILNDSSSQASFLNGSKNKYSAKAVARSGTIDKTLDEVIQELQKSKDRIQNSLIEDSSNFLKSDTEKSFISLLTPYETYSEWDFSNKPQNIYEMLILFGLSGYPVKFKQNNACQMDPFQTFCYSLEPYMIDSSSITLSNQLERRLETVSKEQVTDILVLVDPNCPNTSLAAMKSNVYQYLASVTLCRDLYMYNSNMTFAFHAHSLRCSLESTNRWNIEMSLRILYSIRKYGVNKSYFDLFDRWWNQWSGVTQSNDDSCDHPVQLPILLAFSKVDSSNKIVPFKNMIAEYVSRGFKILLRGSIQDATDSLTKNKATLDLREFFGIDESNSPRPIEDILAQEPTLEEIIEKCQKWSNVNTNSKLYSKYGDLIKYINNLCLPMIRAFEVALYVSSNSNFIDEIESQGKIPDSMIDFVSQILEPIKSLDTYIFQSTNSDNNKNLYLNLFAQSYFYHFSSDRNNLKDFQDSECLEDIIVKLRLSVYFESCKVKREEYQRIIGDVTYADALSADISRYRAIIGVHTHGLSHDQFWALARAAKNDTEKKTVFLEKSNSYAADCFSKI